MSVKIEVYEETKTHGDMAEVLRKIAGLLETGYTSGYNPGWEAKTVDDNQEEDSDED
jgi:hypothetical protein